MVKVQLRATCSRCGEAKLFWEDISNVALCASSLSHFPVPEDWALVERSIKLGEIGIRKDYLELVCSSCLPLRKEEGWKVQK